MDTVITFTPASLFAGILAVCAGISCIAAAIGWVIKGIQAAKAPAKKVDERLTALEKTTEEYKQFFANDKNRLDAIEDGNRVTQRAILALLSHGIAGNDIDSMKAAKKELQEYLIDRT